MDIQPKAHPYALRRVSVAIAERRNGFGFEAALGLGLGLPWVWLFNALAWLSPVGEKGFDLSSRQRG